MGRSETQHQVSAPPTPAPAPVEPKPAQPTPAEPARPLPAGWITVLSWILPLWLLLIPIRGQVMGYGWYWLQSPIDQGRYVLAGAYLDLLYALGLGLIFWPVLAFARARGTALRRTTLSLFIGAVFFSLLGGMANIQVVPMIGHPLTYPWLYYSGFLHSYDALQAISAGASLGIALGAIACVAGLVLLAWLIGRYLTARPAFWRYVLPSAIVLALYFPLSIRAMADFHRPTLQNPVYVFASSLVGSANVQLFSTPTSAPTTDFCTLAELQASESQAPAASEDPAWGEAPQARVRRGAGPTTTQPAPIRNVLFIVMESVGAQYLPAYGGPQFTTPNLDRYRQHARLYRSIYAHAPSTNKSLVSLLCSMYPWPTYRFLTQEAPNASVVSISDVLKGQGYRTALFSAADLRFGYAQSFLEHHQFDLLRDYRTIGDGKAQFISHETAQHLDGVDDATVTKALTDWIAADTQHPFFAVFWTNQTHYPYFPSPASLTRAMTQPAMAGAPTSELLTKYLASLQDSDAAIGNLLGELDRLGLADSTLVVVLGDHGEAFGQHGRFGHGNQVKEVARMGGNFGHGSDLYEENIHIPLLLINRNLFHGEEDAAVGGLVDIAPTVLDHLQLPLPGLWQGRSLAAGRPDAMHGREKVYFTAPWSGAVFGYREGDRKFLYDAINDRYRVFDLVQDPAEQSNLAGEYTPEQLKATYQHLAAWVQYQERFVRRVSQPAH